MPVSVVTTVSEYKKIAKVLRVEGEVICLDKSSHVLYLLVAQNMLAKGQTVKAKIVQGY